MSYTLSIVIPLALFSIIDLAIFISVLKQETDNWIIKVFREFAGCVLIQQLAAALTYAIEGGLITWTSIQAIYVLYMIAIFSMTVCSFYWLIFLLLSFTKEAEKIRAHTLVLLIPIGVCAVAAISSPWTHWLFYIGENNAYYYGKFSVLLQLSCPYSYMLMAIVALMTQLKKRSKKELFSILNRFLLFVLPSVIGAVLQIFVHRGGYTQIGISVGMLLMFMQLYVEEFNEIKNTAELNKKLQETNEAQQKQLQEISKLNAELEANHEKLVARMDIIHSMSKIYFSSYYIDIQADTFEELASRENIRKMIGSVGNAQESLYAMCDKLIQPEYSGLVHDFVNLSTLDERLRNTKVVTCEYKGMTTGWSQAYIIEGDRDSEGKLKHVFFATRMIHEEKEREEVQKKELEKALEAAEAASRAKTSFLFNMSHDIRTPMNAIMGFRDLLEKYQEDPDKRADYLEKIKSSSKVLLSIINNVLEMSRIEKGTLQLNEQAWRAEHFLDALYSVFAEMMEEKGIIFTKEIHVQHQYIFCDPIKIREVFINILSNAYKYTNAGGSVHILLEEIPCGREGYVLYRTTVSDTGIGMSEEFLPRLYDEFSRENTSVDVKIEGTGLGMPIVKRLVEFMDGTIEVTSRKNEGTSFVITVPHRIAEKSDLAEPQETGTTEYDFSGKRILLAEDNSLNAEITMEILSDVGIEVDLAEDGFVCIKKMLEAEPDYYQLVLMDIQMPNMNGYEATSGIRTLEDPKKASIPVIAMTANAFEEDKREAIKAGMNGHLGKPIDVKELMKELSKYLA